LNDVTPQTVIQFGQLAVCPKDRVSAAFNSVSDPLSSGIERIKPSGCQTKIAGSARPSQWAVFLQFLSTLPFFIRLKCHTNDVIATGRRVAAIDAMQSASECETRQVNACNVTA
jgi:hypothetical protein